MSPRWMLPGLRWTYCVFIAAASITAAASAQHGLHEGTNHPQVILALASTETVAVLALAIEPIQVIGCAGLLVVYLIAGVVSVFSADLIGVLRFIFYAAVAAYIVLASRTNQVASHGQG
jgi:hypothetical protein